MDPNTGPNADNDRNYNPNPSSAPDIQHLLGALDGLGALLSQGKPQPREAKDDLGLVLMANMVQAGLKQADPYLELVDQLRPQVAETLAVVLAQLMATFNDVTENDDIKTQSARFTTNMATSYKQQYDALVTAGFSADQAMQIMLTKLGQGSTVLINSLSQLGNELGKIGVKFNSHNPNRPS